MNNSNKPIATEEALGVETHFNRKYREFDSFYEERKGWLARCIDGLFRKSMRLRYERVLALVAPYEGRRVLDVGCGAGRYVMVLARLGIERGLGIDFAENMIMEARRKAEEFGLGDKVRFERGDFLKMELAETYDFVYAMGVMDYIVEPVPFVQKMMAGASDAVLLSFPRAGGFVQWCRRHYFYQIKKCPVYFYTREGIEELVRAVGATRFTLTELAKDYFLEIHVKPLQK